MWKYISVLAARRAGVLEVVTNTNHENTIYLEITFHYVLLNLPSQAPQP